LGGEAPDEIIREARKEFQRLIPEIPYLDDGWIRRVDDPLPNRTKRERKAYALTEQGRRVLNAEIARLRELVSIAQIQTAEETA
jgi:hypothetical protein